MDTPLSEPKSSAPGPEAVAAPTQPAGGEPAPYRGPDRRSRPTPRFSRFTWSGGRRRRARRAGENDGSFVDQYSVRLVAIMIWIAAMNAGDSFFTLLHLQAGGIELNPVADAMLGTGRWGFVILKSALITIPLIVLTLHKNFPLARLGIWTAASAYTALLGYHIALL